MEGFSKGTRNEDTGVHSALMTEAKGSSSAELLKSRGYFKMAELWTARSGQLGVTGGVRWKVYVRYTSFEVIWTPQSHRRGQWPIYGDWLRVEKRKRIDWSLSSV